ncbi:MAG: glycosyltransferase [Candidatus Nealsonbacteria bacterium]
MKILYIALKYDYGKPERGFSFEHYNFYDSLTKMDNGRNQVVYFPFDEIIQKAGREKMNQQLLETVYQEKPDLCFFFLFEDEIKKEVIREITEKNRSITFNWFADDHWRFDNYSKYWIPYFNWMVTTDSKALAKYQNIGFNNVIKSQWACNYFLYKPLNLPKIYDVTFVSQPHGNRKKVVEKIKEAGIDIKCWGQGWPEGRISQEEMIKIFSQSKINLNLTKSSGVMNWKTLAKIFLRRRHDASIRPCNPREWIDNFKSILGRRREQIKGRNFEIPGCRGFLLTSGADNLAEYYRDGKEIVIYKDTKDLIDKIRYYLIHDEEREAIAKVGYEKTLRDHTYEKRFNEIFKVIGLIK